MSDQFIFVTSDQNQNIDRERPRTDQHLDERLYRSLFDFFFSTLDDDGKDAEMKEFQNELIADNCGFVLLT